MRNGLMAIAILLCSATTGCGARHDTQQALPMQEVTATDAAPAPQPAPAEASPTQLSPAEDVAADARPAPTASEDARDVVASAGDAPPTRYPRAEYEHHAARRHSSVPARATYAAPVPVPVPVPAQVASDYPRFPLPAPRPSAKVGLPFDLLGANLTSVGAVERSLRRTLAAKGYDDRSYYAVPGGFALATRAERFLPDGRSAPAPRRWAMAPSALIDWAQLSDPRQWISAFRQADPGHYRVLVFLVTDRDRTTGGGAVTIDTAEAWTTGGADRLPEAIAALPLTADSHLEVLVYEFARAAVSAPPAFVPSSALGARAHLRAAGLVGG